MFQGENDFGLTLYRPDCGLTAMTGPRGESSRVGGVQQVVQQFRVGGEVKATNRGGTLMIVVFGFLCQDYVKRGLNVGLVVARAPYSRLVVLTTRVGGRGFFRVFLRGGCFHAGLLCVVKRIVTERWAGGRGVA